MEHIEELRAIQAKILELNQMVEQLIRSGQGEEDTETDGEINSTETFESIYPLCMEPGFFKGKSVVAVIFPDGVRTETPTWKKLAEVVMKRCNEDTSKHQALMDLRRRVQGRSRQLLGNTAEGMRSALKIDRGLYMETHYDTESLLRIMKTRILDAVGYDYSGIQVAIRNR